MALLLAEGACTKGYKSYVPWNTDQAKQDDTDKGGTAVLSEPAGTVVIKDNAVFISNNQTEIKNSDIREIYNLLQPLANRNILKVLFALYALTADSDERYVSAEEISEKCCLSVSAVENALDNRPVQLKQKDAKFRIDGPYLHIPPLLFMFSER